MHLYLHKSSGISLMVSSLLIVFTMVLHPVGGSLNHLLEITHTIKVTHIMAISCLPLLLFGFYGLSMKLVDKWKLAILALITMFFGLISAMFAAIVNGLALPYFLASNSKNIDGAEEMLQSILSYGFALNKALDYVFIVACCIGIVIYSILMVKTKKFPNGIGYLGVVMFVLVGAGGILGFGFTDLTGFRIFTMSLSIWIVLTGYYLAKTTLSDDQT